MNPGYPTTSPSLKSTLGSHIPVLDGVRGLAVLLVFFHHSVAAMALGSSGALGRLAVKVLASGWIGVDIFFALSGFLITGILLDSKGGPRYFTNFYAKRTLRIFPLYYISLFFLFFVLRPLLSRIYFPSNDYSSIEHAQGWFWAYMQNWYFVRAGGSPVPVTQLWSLAIEEQFYLVWPLVVFFCAPRRIVFISAIICVATPFIRFFLIRHGWDQTAIYMSTITHVDPLLLGALVAAYARSGLAIPTLRQASRVLAALVIIGGFAVVIVDHGMKRDGLALQTIGFSVIAGCSALLIAITIIGAASRLNALLSHPSLRLVGEYSYSFYVFHPPVLYSMAWFLRARLGLLPHDVSVFSFAYLFYLLVSLAATMLLSFTTWHLFEARLLSLKRYFNDGASRAAAPSRSTA